MGKVVGLTYDLRAEYTFREGDPVDANAEFDKEVTVDTVADALQKRGHKVIKIGNVHRLLEKIDNLGVDIIFNIAEGVGKRNRESQVPVILEMKNIPYVGSDGLTLALTLDKIVAKKMMIAEGIPTPKYIEVSDVAHLNGALKSLRFPLIVKPKHEGTSKGISQEAKVNDADSLKKRAAYIINAYKQPALVEEFIIGREFTIGLIGNDPVKVLPPVQVKICGKLDLGEEFFTFARVQSDELEYVCPAQVSKELNDKISELALRTYKAVECKDFGRVDIRVDENNQPFVLEINPLPSLSVEDTFMIVTKVMGLTFTDIINEILDAALKRNNIKE